MVFCLASGHIATVKSLDGSSEAFKQHRVECRQSLVCARLGVCGNTPA